MLALKVIVPARLYKLDVHIAVRSCSYQFPLQTEIFDQGRKGHFVLENTLISSQP
jgi:hypothetical protein